MFKLSFSDGLAIVGFILAIVLVVLDKAGKLKGTTLFVLLTVAAALTLPLALGNTWVANSPSIAQKIFRGMRMLCIVGASYTGLCVWISTGDAVSPNDVPEPTPSFSES